MKIVRIIARLNVGGPARHVVWLTDALARDGFESVLVTGSVPENEDSLEWFAEEKGVHPVHVKEMSRELSPMDIFSLIKILRIFFTEKPDIIHTHTAKAGTLGRVAGFLYRLMSGRRVRMVHTYHGHVFRGYYGPLMTKMFLFIEKLLARFATDRIIVISELQKKEIYGEFGVGAESQFSVIPLGLDLDYLKATDPREKLRMELGFAPDTFLLVFSGRLTEIKNIPLLLKSFALLRSRGFTKTGLIVLGDGHLKDRLMEEAAFLGIVDAVRFLGTVRSPAEYIRSADCVVLSSLNEGTPLSLLEAMALGRSVLSTEVGGVPDILGDVVANHGDFSVRRNGLGVPSGNEEALANAIEWLVANPDQKRELEARALHFVEDNYSKQRLVSDIEELYRTLVGRSA